MLLHPDQHKSIITPLLGFKAFVMSLLQLEEQDQAALKGKLSEMQQVMEELKQRLAESEASRTTEEEISRELQEQVRFFFLLCHLLSHVRLFSLQNL